MPSSVKTDTARKSLGFLQQLPTQVWPWEDSSLSELEMAFRRMRAMFEFLDKLGVDFWAFHDRCAATCFDTLQCPHSLLVGGSGFACLSIVHLTDICTTSVRPGTSAQLCRRRNKTACCLCEGTVSSTTCRGLECRRQSSLAEHNASLRAMVAEEELEALTSLVLAGAGAQKCVRNTHGGEQRAAAVVAPATELQRDSFNVTQMRRCTAAGSAGAGAAKHNCIDQTCHRRRDIAPEMGSLEETNAALRAVVALAEELQATSGKRVLWGTAQLFKHPRYAHGAATSAHRP